MFTTDYADSHRLLLYGVAARNNWRLILEDVATRNIDELIFGGDIGKKETNKWFFDSFRDFKKHVILGNHDDFDEVKKYFKNSLSKSGKELFYAYEEGLLKYIYLDTSSAELSQHQFQWLTREIQTNKKILLLMHHPLLKIDSPLDRSYPLKGREEIKDLLHASEREITIMCGHYHTADEQWGGKH
ncbi:MAG: metallophosphoesterase [Fulvivirga sp.]